MAATGKRSLRRLYLGALACAVCLIAAVGTASASTLPAQGTFENCNLDTQMTTCVNRLAVMHEGGLQVVAIQPSFESLQSLHDYANAAGLLGISVMWELSDPGWWQDPSTSTSMATTYPDFVTACGCNQNSALLAYMVRWLSQLPATYGYYAADDWSLPTGDTSGVASYVNEIKQQDPAHTVMISAGDEDQANEYQPIADVIGTEIYPVTTSSLMPVSANQDTWDGVGQEAGDAQQSADRAGKQSAFILQAFTFGDNLSDGQVIGACTAQDTQQSCNAKLRYPSSAEQLELRNEVLQNAHPKLILWYSFFGTYGDVTGNTASIFPTGADAASRWSGLSAAIQAPFPTSGASSASVQNVSSPAPAPTASQNPTASQKAPAQGRPAVAAKRHQQPRAHIALVNPRMHRLHRRPKHPRHSRTRRG